MTPHICARETEVLHLVTIGQWPRQADAELVTHASSCDACGDVILVATALREIDDEVAAAPVLPEAGAVWQRAQWQARQEAMQRAARPVVAVQGIVATGTVAMIVAAIAWLVSTSDETALVRGVQTIGTTLAASTAALPSLPALDVPAGVWWTVAGALALGLAVIAVAIGLTTLADLQSEPPARR